MQNTKDTFLITLRDRLVLLNPDRTCVVRGATRPAVLAAENELMLSGETLEGTFVLHWHAPATDGSEALPLDSSVCEIRYATSGSAEVAGIDRGRVLDAMDGELQAMLRPADAAKWSYSETPAQAMATRVFWSDVAMGVATVSGAGLQRTATVTVHGWREAGE